MAVCASECWHFVSDEMQSNHPQSVWCTYGAGLGCLADAIALRFDGFGLCVDAEAVNVSRLTSDDFIITDLGPRRCHSRRLRGPERDPGSASIA